MSVSSWFFTPSLQVGTRVEKSLFTWYYSEAVSILLLQIFELQKPVLQSLSIAQDWFRAQRVHCNPPQSISVSSWFFNPSLQDKAEISILFRFLWYIVRSHVGRWNLCKCWWGNRMPRDRHTKWHISDRWYHRSQHQFHPDFSLHHCRLELKVNRR